MIKQEINEIKRLFTPNSCSITRICGCYVDGEKNKKTDFKEAFLSLPEEEIFKYFELLRKTLSGSIGTINQSHTEHGYIIPFLRT